MLLSTRITRYLFMFSINYHTGLTATTFVPSILLSRSPSTVSSSINPSHSNPPHHLPFSPSHPTSTHLNQQKILNCRKTTKTVSITAGPTFSVTRPHHLLKHFHGTSDPTFHQQFCFAVNFRVVHQAPSILKSVPPIQILHTIYSSLPHTWLNLSLSTRSHLLPWHSHNASKQSYTDLLHFCYFAQISTSLTNFSSWQLQAIDRAEVEAGKRYFVTEFRRALLIIRIFWLHSFSCVQETLNK